MNFPQCSSSDFSLLADAFFKAAIGLIPEVPKMISIDGKLRPSEPFLLEFLCNFFSTLLIVPVCFPGPTGGLYSPCLSVPRPESVSLCQLAPSLPAWTAVTESLKLSRFSSKCVFLTGLRLRVCGQGPAWLCRDPLQGIGSPLPET